MEDKIKYAVVKYEKSNKEYKYPSKILDLVKGEFIVLQNSKGTALARFERYEDENKAKTTGKICYRLNIDISDIWMEKI